MTKEEVQARVLQGGKPLELSRFTWYEGTRTFSSDAHSLVIDFQGIADCTFVTMNGCTFNAGHRCTFKTGHRCTFKTGVNGTFKTGNGCTFETGSYCTFKTGYNCTFKTGYNCTFKTGGDCTFETGSYCTFVTRYDCTFNTGRGCIWAIGSKSYPFAPLFIQGSQWPVNACRPGYLKIGCREYTFSVWGRCAKKVAEEEAATKETLEEYLGLIKVAKAWAKQKGWLLPK